MIGLGRDPKAYTLEVRPNQPIRTPARAPPSIDDTPRWTSSQLMLYAFLKVKASLSKPEVPYCEPYQLRPVPCAPEKARKAQHGHIKRRSKEAVRLINYAWRGRRGITQGSEARVLRGGHRRGQFEMDHTCFGGAS
ncbi:hypothetical protein F5888DRAFT_1635538 [Russula emetica]|nr:hypothetical protein F5888DRAFT_1635538 [Russula emetica]